jgi:hypothetical protein
MQQVVKTSGKQPATRAWLSGGLAIALAVACSPPQVMSPGGGAGGTGAGGSSPGAGGAAVTGGGSGSGGNSGAGGGFTVADGGALPLDAFSVDTGTCGFEKFSLQHRPAELLLVLDRSGSMGDTLAGRRPMVGDVTKWDTTTPALDEIITKTESQILWGLKMFPVGNDATCASADGVEAPLKLNNAATVISMYKTAGPLGDGTPTAEAIKRAVVYMKANPSQNTRYLLLATDGEPTCMDGIDGDLRDDAAAVQAIKDAAAAGLHTFVVGIATQPSAATVLDNMATAGLEPRATAPHYYLAANKQDLINAFGIITGKVADCTFPLTSKPPSPQDVAVKIGTERVAQDTTHMNGWDYSAGNTSIVVYGATCERVKAGAAGDDVSITFGCPGQSIP